jgi:short-subunit dehydrogenase
MLQQHDLTEQGSPAAIFDVLSKAGVQVDVLINNAGFGDCGAFVNANLNRQLDMLRLNNFALTALCHYFAQAMVQRKQGRIVNIASVAAFLPGPQMAVYYATKAYVLNFSLALNYELRKDGVTVTTVCPGPTATNFAVTANIQNAKLFKGKKLPTAASVADATIQGFERGRALVIPGFSNWLLATLVPIMPRSMTLAVVNKLNQT